MGQDINGQLEGVLHANPINYWDYIQTDALLNLQTQRTTFPDEMVFIMYHQVNELLFKMILWEIDQVTKSVDNITVSFFSEKLGRISRYFDMLTASFSIMRDGMDMDQYLKFRLTLSPASGFQSAQYRKIEFSSTTLNNLVDARFREKIKDENNLDVVFEHLYWQAAGKDHTTGNKSFTLKDFERKYKAEFLRFIKQYKNQDLYSIFKKLPSDQQKDPKLRDALRHYDSTVNITWVMAHYRTAQHYLNQGKKPLEATGGSSWVKYMHPKYQRRIFFPDLWTPAELENWGQEQPT